MSTSYFLFPFEKVKRGARIVLYGAGTAGQQFLQQMRATNYAVVLAVADKNWERYDGLGMPVMAPNDLRKMDFDFVVVTVQKQEIAEAIACELSGILAPEKIILGCERRQVIRSSVAPAPKNMADYSLAFRCKGYVPIALYMGCGMGDTLVIKRKMDELMSWDPRMLLDIWVTESLMEPVRSFYRDAFGGRVHAILGAGYEGYAWARNKYAVSLRHAVDLCVDGLNGALLWNKPGLLNRFRAFSRSRMEYGLFCGTDNALHYHRCKLSRLWAYTSCNCYDGFAVEDFHTKIPMVQKYKAIYQGLGLRKRYITMNFGFDTSAVGKGRLQAKAWPLKRFSQLAMLIKKKFPDIRILQVGGADFPRIEGCDAYFLGESLELVKYILQGARLHIDIEGGLVHLASQLGTKCAVLFGPTPMHFYGYMDNINIRAEGKCHECYWLVPNHYSCYRQMEKPECMYAITPDMVMERIEGWLVNEND